MDNKSNYTQIQCGVLCTISPPKKIAKITVCGAMTFVIDDTMTWKEPTPEQIKNLHDTLCIDVEVFK